MEKYRIKHFNECKALFMSDNRDYINEMMSAIKNKEFIEICSGPCKGMTIKTTYDVHMWIDKHAEHMANS
jgi:RNA-splicing ligase RtcB